MIRLQSLIQLFIFFSSEWLCHSFLWVYNLSQIKKINWTFTINFKNKIKYYLNVYIMTVQPAFIYYNKIYEFNQANRLKWQFLFIISIIPLLTMTTTRTLYTLGTIVSFFKNIEFESPMIYLSICPWTFNNKESIRSNMWL